MKFAIILSILFISHMCSANTNEALSRDSRLYGKAKFKDNIISLTLFNESDSDIYVLDSYFIQGFSNSKWFYRWNKSQNMLKLSFVPIAWHLFFRQTYLWIPDTYIENPDLNNSKGWLRTYLSFDTIPSHGTKEYWLVTQNFQNINEVLIDRDSIYLYDITKFKFANLKQVQKQMWYIELAIYDSILYLDRRNEFIEHKMFEQLFSYTPLLIKIE